MYCRMELSVLAAGFGALNETPAQHFQLTSDDGATLSYLSRCALGLRVASSSTMGRGGRLRLWCAGNAVQVQFLSRYQRSSGNAARL